MAHPDPESWMWERAREVLERADKLQRHFFELRGSRDLRPTWEPPVDVFECDQELWVLVALPGVHPDRVEIVIEGDVLTVAGERTMPEECRSASVHRLEIPHGRFERQVELPAGHFEVAQKDLKLGCLVLSLKKVA